MRFMYTDSDLILL